MSETPSLWQHQIDAIKAALPLPEYALFFEQGTGKTRTMIDILRGKCNAEKRMLRTLILCPVIVVKNWKEEIAKFSKIPLDKVYCLLDSEKKRTATVEKECFGMVNGGFEAGPKGAVLIVNYEGLLMKTLFDVLLKWRPEVLILDESQRCKSHKSKRTKLATQLSDSGTRHRYLLSGTPVLNHPDDIFSQYRILDGGKTFGKNFFAFQRTYFYDKNAGMLRNRAAAAHYFPNWVVKPNALELMNQKIYSKAMRVLKADCLDLPPMVRQTIEIDLAPDHKRLYLEMKKDFITFLGDRACVATLAITKALRLQQIVSGYVKTDDGKEVQIKDNPRAKALKELLEDITPSHKVIVWAVFKENYEQIRAVCADLGIEYVEVHGEVGNTDKFRNVERFNTDASVRVLIGHPGSGGIGINLVAASYSIFYSRSFSLEHDLQAEARNYRGGSEIHAKVTRIDLVARGTIDEQVLKALSDKQEVSDKMLQDWKEKI